MSEAKTTTKELGCRSCRHSTYEVARQVGGAQIVYLTCGISFSGPSLKRCDAFEYEPGTDEGEE